MDQLIKNIRDGERIHYFCGYPRKECKKIFNAVDRQFKGDVREISDIIHWKDIKVYKEKIKIIHTDNIINEYRLGEDFKNLINDGSIYLLFSRDKIHDFTIKPHWLKFIKELDDTVKYEYKVKRKEKKITGEFSAITKSKKNYRRTAHIFSHIILIFWVCIYFAIKIKQKERFNNIDWLFLFCTTVDCLNLFFGFYIAEFLKNRLEPFIESQMQKYNIGISNIKKLLKKIKLRDISKKIKASEEDIDE